MKLLYIEGELDDAEYRRQRAEIAASLAAIPVDDLPSTEAVGRRLAQMLAELSQAWTLAMPAERNAIAQEVFADVVIENRTAVAVKPRPELAPFFTSLECQSEASVTSERKRRVLKQHLQYPITQPVRVPVPHLMPREGTPRGTQRYRSRPRKLTPDLLKEIQQQPHRTLRELAEAYGVSHETIRAARRVRSTDGE